ncbi:PAS domain S-box protein [Methylobacter sp. Wu1]|uniref:sensor histidine kinase n=1 Tax=Methylobacter sp. Wu1 TaxID=3119359 RepID=UPI002F95FB52
MNGRFFIANKDRQRWLIIRQWILIWVLLTLVLATVLWIVHKTHEASTLALMYSEGQQTVRTASQTVDEELRLLHGDILYLRDQPVLHEWLEKQSPIVWKRLGNDLLAFVKYRELYDQIRFLDEKGQERVRITWNQGQPVIVPERELQDRSELYFVEQALALDKDDIYISSFDLSIEHGAIEQPIKPVIRFGTPVFDRRGQKRGIILLNYRGQRLIDQLRAISRQSIGSLWLLNTQGYWLVGARSEDEWGFMYPDRKNKRFANDYGEAWRSITEHPERLQFMAGGDLFTYGAITPSALFGKVGENVVAGDGHWLLVAHVPAEVIDEKTVVQARWFAFSALSLLLGAVSWFIAFYRVRRRQVEAEVVSSEARFRGLLESAPDAIVMTNREGNIVLVNAQTEKWFGYARNELLGQPIELLVPERFREHHEDYRQAYMDKALMRPMGIGLYLSGRRKDGSEFPVEINLSPSKIDQELFVTGIIRDITERKRAERAQLEAQAKYRELVDNLPVGVYRQTPTADGRFLEVNPAIVDMFEAESAEQLQAHPVSDLCRDRGCWQDFVDKIMKEGFVGNEEIQLVTLQGREFFAAVSAAMKKDSAGNLYFDGIIEDISRRKENERRIQQLNMALRDRAMILESVNHELEAFSYSVSHDLRAPLRAVDGFSRILLDEYADCLDETGQDRLRRVRAAAQKMATLIDDLLKLSRITRSELKREDVNLSALADEVIEELRKQEPERIVQCAIEPGVIVWGDARLLRVVLDNLIGNAWKFTSKRPEARIEFGRQMQDDEPVYFVRDNGAGFDMAYAEKLFGAFQRLHDSSEFPGTGIGLATVQRIIHKHGGRIWAEGAVEQGAIFYFTLEARENL